MIFYSTNGQAPAATLEKAVVKGLAEDKGLYMPEEPITGTKEQKNCKSYSREKFSDAVHTDFSFLPPAH